ncbi:MAG: hypothetical protein ACJA08_002990 [Cyclobacteriaceae bacterium]|jgi:hypothetical protein
MKSLIQNIGLSIVLLLSVALPLMAQNSPPATPIDGGLSLLLIAGGAYGAKKLYSRRNKS